MSKPSCYHCGRKPARKLSVSGDYGKCVFFCSLRCAAKDAIEGPMIRGLRWCATHNLWIDEGETCYGCDNEEKKTEAAG